MQNSSFDSQSFSFDSQSFSFDSYVIRTGFLGTIPIFVLEDGTIQFFKQKELSSILLHKGSILDATIDKSQNWMAACSDDGRVVTCDFKEQTSIRADHKGKWIDHIATGPNGLIAYAIGKQVFILDKDQIYTFECENSITGLAFAPKGKRIAVSHYNGATLRYFTTSAQSLKLEWKGAHTGILFSPDGNYVVTLMQENALHGWKLSNNQHMRMTGYPTKVKSAEWTYKMRHLATSGAHSLILWPFGGKDGPVNQQPLQGGAQSSLITKVAASSSNNTIASGHEDGTIMLFDSGSLKETKLNKPDTSRITALAMNSQTTKLVYGCENGEAGVIHI